ncbi:hypothetical protein [Winogradskyella sp.]|uniref:hypothetical protein n=1 Tax=Winogradskyella sp. TaxID=1883156 RepID=UPI003F6B98D8
MNKGILFIGGIIFAVYIYFTFWNIFQSHKKQKENHYPELTKTEIFEEYENTNNETSDEK